METSMGELTSFSGLRHEPIIEQRHTSVLEREQVAFVRVAMYEAFSHELHREALDGGLGELETWKHQKRSRDGGKHAG